MKMSSFPSLSSERSEEKYAILPSPVIVMNRSSFDVLIGEPRFAGAPHVPSASSRDIQKSSPPIPSLAAEEK